MFSQTPIFPRVEAVKAFTGLRRRWHCLAERAAWEFVDIHSPEILWDLVIINPLTPRRPRGSLRKDFFCRFFAKLKSSPPSLSPAPTVDGIEYILSVEYYYALSGASCADRRQENRTHLAVPRKSTCARPLTP